MLRFFLFLSFIVLLLIGFSQNTSQPSAGSLLSLYKDADEAYQQADKINAQSETNSSLEVVADEKNRKALGMFSKILPLSVNNSYDSLSFFINLKSGIICHYFDSLIAAKSFYLRALQYEGKANIIDSFFFQPALFAGSIYYAENNFDSAQWYLKYAGNINDKWGGNLEDAQRFYNISGTMSFQTGNYRQALNYFEKAADDLLKNSPEEKSLLINYKINIGITLVKLEEYTKAASLYESLLKEDVFSNEINQNLGFVYLNINEFRKAINDFRKVNYENNKKAADLYRNMSMAFAGLGEKDSSELYLLKAKEENLKWNGRHKNISNGLILKFQADELAKEKRYKEAISYYQQSIIQLCPAFSDTAAGKNPEDFNTVYSYINLFNTLTAKGDALESLYKSEKNLIFLRHSLAAYKAAFSLASYVEKTYNSDEARLFLGKIKYRVHSRPIDISLSLYNITKEKQYLRDAFLFDQQNKASVLALNVQENELKGMTGISNELFIRQASLKSSITRLSLKLPQLTDSIQQLAINNEIRDKEIELDKIQEKLRDNPSYRNLFFSGQLPDVSSLQKKLDNKTTLLSWHLADSAVIVFIVSGARFDYLRIPAGPDFYAAIDSLKSSLHNTETAKRYSGIPPSKWLYKKLIIPVEQKLTNTERLVIIPDDELNYLPFEALQDEAGNYLIQKYAISYQYTASLLENEDKTKKADGVLAFAPFASKGHSAGDSSGFAILPSSGDEISGLNGKSFMDNEALKSNFLNAANHYGIIHLATHASANNESPQQSFISFFPNGNDYKLYASEIYNLTLDSTRLVILSACETGAGQLIKGEGLMSLSRAFAAAGCPNIITSLWKAEDKTTAFITKKLHSYLDEGFTKDRALQQAKLDLLNSSEIDPRFKTPNYWSHLLFIGNYEPDHRSSGWWKIALGIVIASLSYLFVKRKKPGK